MPPIAGLPRTRLTFFSMPTIRWTGIHGARSDRENRARNKPIFLSVGYSACYWMPRDWERSVLRSKEIAAEMNWRS